MGLMLASLRVLGCLLLSGTSVFAACGGKTIDALEAGSPPATPTSSATEAGPPDVDTGGRVCPATCATPHQCCENGCGGIPVALPSACCSCLPGEADSLTCPNHKCGG